MDNFKKMATLIDEFPSLKLAFQFRENPHSWSCLIVTTENIKRGGWSDVYRNGNVYGIGYTADTPEEALDKAIEKARQEFTEMTSAHR